jgi:hypothetical protein
MSDELKEGVGYQVLAALPPCRAASPQASRKQNILDHIGVRVLDPSSMQI